MSDVPAWERRFRAPLLSFPTWAAEDPDHLVVASTESGSYQLHAWDRRTGEVHQVTRDAVGVLQGHPTRDGSGVIWFLDETGDETGTFVIAPFAEDAGAEPLLQGLPRGWSQGLALGRHRTVAAVATDEEYSVWASDEAPTSACSTSTRCPSASPAPMPRRRGRAPGALSADERSSSSRSWRTATCSTRPCGRSTPRRARPSRPSGRRAGAGRVRVLADTLATADRRDPRAGGRAHPALWDTRTGAHGPRRRAGGHRGARRLVARWLGAAAARSS